MLYKVLGWWNRAKGQISWNPGEKKLNYCVKKARRKAYLCALWCDRCKQTCRRTHSLNNLTCATRKCNDPALTRFTLLNIGWGWSSLSALQQVSVPDVAWAMLRLIHVPVNAARVGSEHELHLWAVGFSGKIQPFPPPSHRTRSPLFGRTVTSQKVKWLEP